MNFDHCAVHQEQKHRGNLGAEMHFDWFLSRSEYKYLQKLSRHQRIGVLTCVFFATVCKVLISFFLQILFCSGAKFVAICKCMKKINFTTINLGILLTGFLFAHVFNAIFDRSQGARVYFRASLGPCKCVRSHSLITTISVPFSIHFQSNFDSFLKNLVQFWSLLMNFRFILIYIGSVLLFW